MKKYQKPDDCPNVVTVKANSEIWNENFLSFHE